MFAREFSVQPELLSIVEGRCSAPVLGKAGEENMQSVNNMARLFALTPQKMRVATATVAQDDDGGPFLIGELHHVGFPMPAAGALASTRGKR